MMYLCWVLPIKKQSMLFVVQGTQFDWWSAKVIILSSVLKLITGIAFKFHIYFTVSGYDRTEVDRLISEGKITKEMSKSISQSVSSLDREDEDFATLKQV